MREMTARRRTGRYAVVKVFPFVHAVKVEVEETFVDEHKQVYSECRWRLASDQDMLDLAVPTMVLHAPQNNNKQ